MTRIALLLGVAATLAIAGCGGSGDSAKAPGAESASRNSSEYIVPSSDPISDADSPSVGHYPKDVDNDEVSPTGVGPENPCRLVSHGEAAAILAEGVRTSVGAQGPTCIYAPTGAKPQVTVAIEQTSFQDLRHNASQATPLTVGSKSGLCLSYGSTSVAVHLSEDRVLRVTGPCSLAARFAARALGSVPG